MSAFSPGVSNENYIDGLEVFVDSYPVPLLCKMMLARVKGDFLAVNSILAALELTNAAGPLPRAVRAIAYAARGDMDALADALEEMYRERDTAARMQRLIVKIMDESDESTNQTSSLSCANATA